MTAEEKEKFARCYNKLVDFIFTVSNGIGFQCVRDNFGSEVEAFVNAGTKLYHKIDTKL